MDEASVAWVRGQLGLAVGRILYEEFTGSFPDLVCADWNELGSVHPIRTDFCAAGDETVRVLESVGAIDLADADPVLLSWDALVELVAADLYIHLPGRSPRVWEISWTELPGSSPMRGSYLKSAQLSLTMLGLMGALRIAAPLTA